MLLIVRVAEQVYKLPWCVCAESIWWRNLRWPWSCRDILGWIFHDNIGRRSKSRACVHVLLVTVRSIHFSKGSESSLLFTRPINKGTWLTQPIFHDWYESHFVPEVRAHCRSLGFPESCMVILSSSRTLFSEFIFYPNVRPPFSTRINAFCGQSRPDTRLNSCPKCSLHWTEAWMGGNSKKYSWTMHSAVLPSPEPMYPKVVW